MIRPSLAADIRQDQVNDAVHERANLLDRSSVRARVRYAGVLTLTVAVGMSVRMFAVAGSDFPVNDGGMFYQAIGQIQAAHFHLPAELRYNGLSIPFAYSPLGFYLAALVSSATGASVIQLLRFLPLLFSLATMIAFILLANEYLQDRSKVAVASLAFVLVPRSHNWEIMGGGLTRGLAFTFAVLGLWQTYRLFTRRSRLSLVLAAAFGALTVVSHIEMAWFLVLSSALIFVYYGRSRRGLVDAALLSTGVLILSSPWWATVVARYGLSPFLTAVNSGSQATSNILGLVFMLNWGDEPWFPLFTALALLGIFVSLRRGHHFLPVWIVAALILDTRKFQTDAMVPLAMLVAIAIADLLVPLLSRAGGRWLEQEGSTTQAANGRIVRWLSPTVVALMLGYGWISSVSANSGSYVSLSASERDAMAWIRDSTPRDARFAVVTGDQWALDRSSEWFPVLAERISVATVQGYEWVPNDGFVHQMAVNQALQECSTKTANCLADWSAASAEQYDYVYLAKRDLQRGLVDYHAPCCDGLIDSLAHDPSYSLVFQDKDATIFKHNTSERP